jgi:hypothetical protein
MIIEKHINFEVAEKDEPEKMTWNEAMDKFKDNKDGWRLPTREELLLMYEHKEEVGNFEEDWYWSATPVKHHINFAYLQNFYRGTQNWNYMLDHNRVRCARSIK